MGMQVIPKRFIRIWLGPKDIPETFNRWWCEFQDMHPSYDFITIGDDHGLTVPESIAGIYKDVASYAGRADILRILALHEYGGVYVDTDVMPLKPFDDIIADGRPFAGKRSSKSFEVAVLGSPKGHPILQKTIDALPAWYEKNGSRSCSVATGPAFLSSVWFGSEDVNHLPTSAFYPFNGFKAPSREQKTEMFSDKSNFPDDMVCAHFSNHRWGGKPKTPTNDGVRYV